MRFGQVGLLYAAHQRLLHPVHLRQIQYFGICDRVSAIVHKRMRNLLIDRAYIALRSRRVFGVSRSGNNRYRRTIFQAYALGNTVILKPQAAPKKYLNAGVTMLNRPPRGVKTGAQIARIQPGYHLNTFVRFLSITLRELHQLVPIGLGLIGVYIRTHPSAITDVQQRAGAGHRHINQPPSLKAHIVIRHIFAVFKTRIELFIVL